MSSSARLGAGEWVLEHGATRVRLKCSTVADGDFHLESDHSKLLERRQRFFPGVWTQLDEVHGAHVRTVESPGHFDFAEGDAATTNVAEAVLSVWVGDCAALALVGDSAQFSLVHAGWRGARDGVVASAVGSLRAAGASSCAAFLVSAIGPCCYEFGAADLDPMFQQFGPEVRATTTWGTPSLSMPAVVAAACGAEGVAFTDLSECTHCTYSGAAPLWFSHRRGDVGRHAIAATLLGALS